jgi:hypothetical protein
MNAQRSRGPARWTVIMAIALIGSVLSVAPAPAADEVVSARGSAYGAEVVDGQKSPEAIAEVPPNTSQHDQNTQVDFVDMVELLDTTADACLDGGVAANLQAEMDEARRQALGQEPPPEDQEPPRQTANAPEGYGVDDFCLTPSGTEVPEDPNTNPKCEEYGAAEVPEGGQPPSTCQAPINLWSARGYVESVNAFVFTELYSEAVGRCVGAAPEYASATTFGDLSGSLVVDTTQPNQPLDPLGLGLTQADTVTFWETNWDPETNSVTDGADHVWVNALHIQTPTEDIVIGHSEAKVECAGDEVPVGGYPRDVNLTPSKGIVTYDRVFNLSGSVTPATEFETPRPCIEGVPVTIRRDKVGGGEKFVDIATVETDANGSFSYDVTADYNAQWVAFIAKDSPKNCAQVASSAEPVLVKPFVGLKTSRKTVKRGTEVKLTARLEPCDGKSGTRIKLRRVYKSRAVKVDTKLLDDECRAIFYQTANWKTAVFDAAWPKQDTVHQNGHSRPKVIRTKQG